MNSNPSPEKTHKEHGGSCDLPSFSLLWWTLPGGSAGIGQLIPRETHPLNSDDSLAPTMQLDWYRLFVTGWPMTLKLLSVSSLVLSRLK